MAKVKLEEILNKCSVKELQFALKENKLLSSGNKAELVSRLASSLPPKKIFNAMSNKQLQAILGSYQLPKSGNKSELVTRVLSLVKRPKPESVRRAEALVKEEADTKKADYEKGRKFEDQVAAWARRKFKADFAKTDWAKGAVSPRGHQVDIHVQKRKGPFGAFGHDIWIECKDIKETVKKTHIDKLVSDAKDAYKAYEKGGEELYYDGLMLVSKSLFDIAALRYADEYDVWCIYFDGKTYREQNHPKNWLGEPAWLKQVKYA